jgi:hypothetical protein
MLDMGSDNPYRARLSRAKAALMRDKVQLQLDRFESWLGRFLCPSDWILVTSTDSSNVNRFPYFKRRFNSFSPSQLAFCRSR